MLKLGEHMLTFGASCTLVAKFFLLILFFQGTQLYDPEAGGWRDLGMLDVMQMFGRAGRPQFDKSGEGIIISSHDKLAYYLRLLKSELPIESQFISSMKDNLNAEVVLVIVTNVKEACAWFGYTYLFIRMRLNPLAYGIGWDEVKEVPYTRLCNTKNILTVNGQFPGPTLYAHKGDTIVVDVYNRGKFNITIHWHGVLQTRNPWSDGPEYITQCAIQPGAKFRQKIIFTTEEGTLWWHAHSTWLRATVHGALIVYPKIGTSYPFPKPDAEIPIILGDWWEEDIMELYLNLERDGDGTQINSEAFLINGQPGDLYPCSKRETFRLEVNRGMTYLLRIVNSVMLDSLFFSVANHTVTVVGTDGSYLKPFERSFIFITTGQTVDVLLEANQSPNHYYMAASVYSTAGTGAYNNSTTTATVEYNGNYTPSSPPVLPDLPSHSDTAAGLNFTASLRSLADEEHPIDVPMEINTHLFYTLSMNAPCKNRSCADDKIRTLASVNNISFINPSIDILQAYYCCIHGVYETNFPDVPQFMFDFTADHYPLDWEIPQLGTTVKMLDYNSTVELVLQGTNLVNGSDHPMHLHGLQFYVVGLGMWNFDKDKDPLMYNLVDPPLQNTIHIPKDGWVAIRFKANNPGVWYMHCHFDRHMVWGMDMVFIVKDGESPEAKMLPPPPDMPPC